eukprot:1509227-Rhodomonas_salina.1
MGMNSTGSPSTSTIAISSSRVSKSVCSTLMVRCTSNASGGTRSTVEHGTPGEADEQLATNPSSTARFVEPENAGHETQPTDPADSEYHPWPQSKQPVDPTSFVYVPAGHASHAPEPDEALN